MPFSYEDLLKLASQPVKQDNFGEVMSPQEEEYYKQLATGVGGSVKFPALSGMMGKIAPEAQEISAAGVPDSARTAATRFTTDALSEGGAPLKDVANAQQGLSRSVSNDARFANALVQRKLAALKGIRK